MAVNKKKYNDPLLLRHPLMALIGVAIVVKAGITMFAERQYWQDVADRFVKENVTVKPNRGNIISSDGKLMASSLPEYRIYMDFMSGEKDEKRRKRIRHGVILFLLPIWILSASDFIRYSPTKARPNSRRTSRKGVRQRAVIT